eukprot:Rmarinus@m.10305
MRVSFEAVHSKQGPSPRGGHSLTVYENKAFVFGGGNRHGDCFCDLYCLNLDTMEWCRLEPSGESPKGRSGHSAAFVGRKLYIFGGQNPYLQEMYNDLHSYDVDINQWERLSWDGPRPSARNSHLCFSRGTDVWVLCGATMEGPCCDVWIYGTDTKTWQDVTDTYTWLLAGHIDIPDDGETNEAGNGGGEERPKRAMLEAQITEREMSAIVPWPVRVVSHTHTRTHTCTRTHTHTNTHARTPTRSPTRKPTQYSHL